MNIQDNVVCVLPDLWSWMIGWPGIGKVEGSILRSGADSAWRDTIGYTRPASCVEPPSLLPSLRIRRSIRGGEEIPQSHFVAG